MNRYDYIAKILKEKGYYTATTYGTSMLPMLRNSKDQVVIEPCNSIKKYDVVLYRAPNNEKYLLHRVIGIKNNICIIRGDNLYSMEKVAQKDIIGKMTYFLRGNRQVSVNSLPYKIYCTIIVHTFNIRLFINYIKNKFLSLRVKIKLFIKSTKKQT